MRAATHAAAAGGSAKVALALEVAERGHSRLDGQDHAAAMAAVATIRPAARDVRLAAEGDGAVAAGPGRDEDASAVSEHGDEHSIAGVGRRRGSIGRGGEA